MDNSIPPAAAASSRFDSLPEQIRTFLLSAEVKTHRLEMVKKYTLALEAQAAFAKVRRDFYDKNISFEELPAKASAALGKPVAEIKPLLLEFLGYEALPISDYLGDVDGLIRSLGGDPAAYPTQKITIREVQAADVVTEILHENPVNVPAYLEHRLREILESRVRNVRKDAETVQRLTRAEKIGGAEMDPDEAEKLIEKLSSKIAGIKIAADAPPAMPSAAITPPNSAEASLGRPTPSYNKSGDEIVASDEVSEPTTPLRSGSAGQAYNPQPTTPIIPTKPTNSATSKKGDGFMPADEHEAQAIREQVLPAILTPALFNLDKEITAGSDLMIATFGKSLPIELQTRLRTIVESRLKGVRDQAETAELLGREAGKGGIGLGSVLVNGVMVELEKQVKEIHGQRDETSKKEKEAFVKSTVANTFAKDESRKTAQQEELDRMYGALTGNKKIRQIPPNSAKAPLDMPTPSYNKRGDETPAAPEAQPQAPVASSPTTNNQQPTTKSPYMYTPPPVVLSPKMQDVRPVMATARLTGPVEELKNMTLTDFRRLSSDPVEACRKVTDKLDLLEGHSYGQRIAGAAAWRESEIYRLYLQIITASFSGDEQIPTIIAKAMAANEPTLTEREVHAIMDLNRRLTA